MGLKAKYEEIKAARQRYSDRCELHQHKVQQQKAEQELLEKVQLEQKMKLIEKQEQERMVGAGPCPGCDLHACMHAMHVRIRGSTC